MKKNIKWNYPKQTVTDGLTKLFFCPNCKEGIWTPEEFNQLNCRRHERPIKMQLANEEELQHGRFVLETTKIIRNSKSAIFDATLDGLDRTDWDAFEVIFNEAKKNLEAVGCEVECITPHEISIKDTDGIWETRSRAGNKTITITNSDPQVVYDRLREWQRKINSEAELLNLPEFALRTEDEDFKEDMQDDVFAKAYLSAAEDAGLLEEATKQVERAKE